MVFFQYQHIDIKRFSVHFATKYVLFLSPIYCLVEASIFLNIVLGLKLCWHSPVNLSFLNYLCCGNGNGHESQSSVTMATVKHLYVVCKRGKFYKGLELAEGGVLTNRATPSRENNQ